MCLPDFTWVKDCFDLWKLHFWGVRSLSGKALHPDNDYLQVSVNLAAFMVWQQILSLHNTELLLMYHIAAFMKESSFQFIFFF